jgi:hypothetical protein
MSTVSALELAAIAKRHCTPKNLAYDSTLNTGDEEAATYAVPVVRHYFSPHP